MSSAIYRHLANRHSAYRTQSTSLSLQFCIHSCTYLLVTTKRTRFFKVVLHRSHGCILRVKVKTVKLIGRLLCMPAQIIQTMAFIWIMDIWRPGRSLEDHLNRHFYIESVQDPLYIYIKELFYSEVLLAHL